MAFALHRSLCHQTYRYSLRRKSTEGELSMYEGAAPNFQSDAVLQSAHGERFHNGPGWLCLYDLHLAENFALSCFGCWLDPCLNPAHTWDGEEGSVKRESHCIFRRSETK